MSTIQVSVALAAYSAPIEADSVFFTVYRTNQAIELYTGCEDRTNAKIVCTHKSYEVAYEFAQSLAAQMALSLQDYTATSIS